MNDQNSGNRESPDPLLIVIAGPTASGKSELALWLAEKLDGELICCDSLQVYRRLDIGTAKPDAGERRSAVHHQLDLVDLDQHYSAGRYAREAGRVIRDVSSRSRVPILVGGTGLYLRALLYGLNSLPEISGELRDKVGAWQREEGVLSCWNRLNKIDPVGAGTVHPQDSSRVQRALEIVLSSGKSVQCFRNRGFSGTLRYPVCGIGCEWPREELYERINLRTLLMLKKGWIEEVRSILRDYPRNLKPLKSIGYREIIHHLRGGLDREELTQAIQQRTRQYAKRQLTWFRKDSFLHWHFPRERDRILSEISVCLEKQGKKQG